MRFPLSKMVRGGYDYGVKTTYNDHHLGVDWEANFEPLVAPKNGKILNVSQGPEAGLAVLFQPEGETIGIRWVHLSKSYVTKGQIVKEGDLVAMTGNSGSNTTSPHLHEDIWKNANVTLKFEDTINPHVYYAQGDPMILVENNGTFYLEGEKGYLGISRVEFLNFLYRITDKVEHRLPRGVQLGVVETATDIIKLKES